MQSLFGHNERLAMNMQDATVQWQAEANAVRARLAKTAGYARPDQVAGRSGLEVFAAIFSGELPRPHIEIRSTSGQSISNTAWPSSREDPVNGITTRSARSTA